MAKQQAGNRRFWLFKSEPESYSIGDLQADTDQTTCWSGVRNYQARNMLRDEIQVGDRVFFYHSNADPPVIAGTAKVVKSGYADHTAFDPQEDHYDPGSDPDKPTWYMVDIQLLQVFPEPVTRDQLREDETTRAMKVLAKGSRLSIQPVTAEEWQAVHRLAGVKEAK